MFTINDTLTDLKVKERSIFKMLYSMNSPQVATPDASVEEARCYVLFFSEGPNLSAYIGLYLPRIDRKMFYAYSSNPFPFEAAPDVEVEATGFAEDMGFLLDEINVSGMPHDDRNRWIEEQYIFGYKKPETTGDDLIVTTGEKPKSALDEKEEAHEARTRTEDEKVKTVQVEKEEAQAKAEAEKAKAEAEKAKAEAEKAKAEAEKAKAEAEKAKSEAEQASPVPHLEEPVLPLEPARPQPPIQPQPPIPVPPPVQPQPYQPHQQPFTPQGQPQYPPQPGQPYGQPQPYQQYQQPAPPQNQPAPPVYSHVPPDQTPANVPPAAPQTAPPAAQAKPSVAKKKVHKTAPPPPPVEAFEESVPVEVEEEPAPQRTPSLFEKALKEGVVRPPKPKAATHTRSIGGVVARDKEALARLLASF
jgi:hypothetical protein